MHSFYRMRFEVRGSSTLLGNEQTTERPGLLIGYSIRYVVLSCKFVRSYRLRLSKRFMMSATVRIACSSRGPNRPALKRRK